MELSLKRHPDVDTAEEISQKSRCCTDGEAGLAMSPVRLVVDVECRTCLFWQKLSVETV